jgi:hypothetical protein
MINGVTKVIWEKVIIALLGESDHCFVGDILRYFLGETEENIKGLY